MNKKHILAIIMILSFLGIIETSILSFAKYNNDIEGICGENKLNSCNTVQNSKYSNLIDIKNDNGDSVINIPLTIAGLFYYIVIYFISIFYLKKLIVLKDVSKKFKKIFLILSGLGLTFSIIFTLIQAFLIKAFCIYCLISALNTLLIFILVSSLYFVLDNKEENNDKKKHKNVAKK